jgi:hypothetical protein
VEKNGVEAALTSTVKQNSPRGLVLNTEKMTVKFNKDVIIPTKAIDRQKVCAKAQNMKNVFQVNRRTG